MKTIRSMMFCLASAGALIACGAAASDPDGGRTERDATTLADAPASATDAAFPPSDAAFPPSDAAFPPTDAGPRVCDGDSVDLLFVVDNTGTMIEEQARVADGMLALVSILATGDRDGDGTADFTPISDLQVGVVSIDLGAGAGNTPPMCLDVGGDNARLLVPAGCGASSLPFLRYTTGGAQSIADFSADAACRIGIGGGGCGIEQSLESMLRAVTPSTSPARFFGGEPGQRDLANAGFFRPRSVLAIVLVTDEDDCSPRDAELFRVDHPGAYDSRCVDFPSEVQPVARYVDGLRAAHPGGAVVVSVVGGVPPDLVDETGLGANAAVILADPRMTSGANVDGTPRVACSVGTETVAYPTRRLVELVDGLGERGSLFSICRESLTPTMAGIANRIGDALDVCPSGP